MSKLLATMAAALAVCAAAAPAQTIPAPVTYTYSLDLGSDWDLTDPTGGELNQMDCGDIYREQFLQTPPAPPPPLVKDDDAPVFPNTGYPFALGSALQPLPGPPVPGATEPQVLAQYQQFWDCDATDQLGIESLVPQTPAVVPLQYTVAQLKAFGIHVNPGWIGVSFDDDFANGWYKSGDIPTIAGTPHRGHGAAGGPQQEIWEGAGPFGAWTPLQPVRDEDQIGVPLMNAGDHHDDDVDALDVEDHRFWYFSPDHEAHNSVNSPIGTLDPGDIYICDLKCLAG